MIFSSHFTKVLHLTGLLSQSQQPLQDDIHHVTTDRDEYIAQIMEEFHLPGVALAIVNGSDIWAKGYGYSQLPSKPVTPSTLFYAASITKSHTAAGISLFIDDNKDYDFVQWTTPLSHLLREDFILQDEWATAHITIQDALSHRTGMARHDLAYSPTQRGLVRNLRNLPMAAEPRAKWMYCNHMYHTIGHLIEVLSGQWLGDFFRERLWEPLGMNSTFLSLSNATNSGLDLATPYWWNNRTQKYQEIPMFDVPSTRAAGGIRSNVLDYAKWVRAMMYKLTPMSTSSHDAIVAPSMIARLEGLPAMQGPMTYGFGWDILIYGGETVITHSGEVDGFESFMCYLPNREWGIVLMSNIAGPALEIIAWHLIDEYLELPSYKRANLANKLRESIPQELRHLAETPSRVYPSLPDPPLPRPVPLSAYAGKYNDAGYGNFAVREVCNKPGDCVLRGTLDEIYPFFPFQANLTHVSGQYWLAYVAIDSHDPNVTEMILRAQFEVGVNGIVEGLGLDVRMEGEDVPLIWFKRI